VKQQKNSLTSITILKKSGLGCGKLPTERDRMRQSHQDAHAKGNPKVDKNVVKGYN